MSAVRFLAALLALAWGCLTLPAADAQLFGRPAAVGEQDRSHGLKVSAQLLPAAENQPPRLSITADIPIGWHIYSITQKPGGPKRSNIQLPESKQFRLAAALTPAPAPTVEREKYKEIWPDLPVEEHEGRVTWTAPLELADGVDLRTLAIEGQLKAFMCSDQCVDVTLPFTAKVAAPADAGSMAMLLGTLLIAAPSDGATPPAAVQPTAISISGQPAAKPPAAPLVPNQSTLTSPQMTITGKLDHEAVAPGGTAELTFTLAPATGWHTYPMPDVPSNSVNKPTLLVVTDRASLEVGATRAAGMIKSKSQAAGPPEKYYQGPLKITVPVKVPAGTSPGAHTLYGLIGYQACKDVCASPTGARFSITVNVAPASLPGNTPAQFVRYTYSAAAIAAGLEKPVEVSPTPSPPENAAAIKPLEDTIAVAPYGGGGYAGMYGLWFDLLLAFIGGLLLNAMPCVLPVIGLKVMSFVQQAGQNRRQVLVLNLWFSLGVLLVFLVWASLIAFFAKAASAQFQRPEFSITLAAITFAFALSLLGVWEIPIPGFVGSGTAQQVGERGGASGAVAKGVLSTILATPCVGPLIGGTVDLTIKDGSMVRIFAIYTVMGLGMAFPYLVLGANPALLRWLPKPGMWMETFKNVMGFMLLATVVWIFTFMPPEYFVSALALIFGVWAACWWIGRTPLTAEFGPKLRAWAVAALIVLGVSVPAFRWLVRDPVTPGAPQLAANAVWQPYSTQRLQQLRAQGTTVFVDFTANWCPTCQTNKLLSLHRKSVEQYMRDHNIVALVADKTLESPEIDSLMTRLGHPSGFIPFYAVFPAAGGPVITYEEPLLFEGTLLDMLRQAGPSRVAANPATSQAVQR